MPLTDLACRKAKPQARPFKLSDSGGLYLEVSPKGHKWWRQKYRFNGKEKRLSLGVFPNVSLQQAREKQQAVKETLAKNIDPGVIRQEEKTLAKIKAAQTFQLVAEEWHTLFKPKWSKSHADNLEHRMEVDLFPHIGSIPVSQLTPPLVYAVLQKIEARASDQARRARSICGQVLRYAVVTGRAERNFMPDLRGQIRPIRRNHFAAFDYNALPEFLKKLNTNEKRLYKRTILAIRLLMLTFVRTRELIEAKRSEFDLEKSGWTIPAERMKTRIEHFVPLSAQVVVMLQELFNMTTNSEYLFPGIANPNKPMSNGTILKALKTMEYGGKMTGHGFRSLAMSTIKEKLGYPHEVVDRQLAHLPRSQVDRAYDRAKYLPDRRKMMQDWADYIDGLS